MSQKPARITPTPSPSTREELEAKRNGVVATGPSGARYRIRPVNPERHALAGGLPTELRKVAMQVANGGDPLRAAARELVESGEEELKLIQDAAMAYNDQLVLAAVVEPELTVDDLGKGETLDEDPLVPANDYQWLLSVAKGDEEYDAEGMHLWGLEPLNRFATFRELHSCSPDCEGCAGYRRLVSAVSG